LKRLPIQPWQSLLLIAMMSCLFVACNPSESDEVAQKNDVKVVEHGMGKTEVPIEPERIVTLDYQALESTLALGFQPVGAVLNGNLSEQPDYLEPYIQSEMVALGAMSPNLERIVQLEPDLILGSKLSSGQSYDRLSQIAPTVLMEQAPEIEKPVRFYGNVLGRPQKAEQEINHYQERLQNLRETNSQEIAVSIIRLFPAHIRVYFKDSFSGRILEQAGFKRPPAQNRDINYRPISNERIEVLDGDVMFVITVGKQAETAMEEFLDNPLWSQLSVVQRDQVYQVSTHWLGPGVIAANAVLDDLEKYVLNEPKETANSREMTQAL